MPGVMSGDERVADVDNFTKRIHSSVPDSLRPEKVQLPAGFTVCIIGVSYGIGEHIAYAYAKAGVTNLCLAARSDSSRVAERTRELASSQSFHIETAECDIADAKSVEKLAIFVKEKFGRLDVVVPNAAYAGPVTLMMDQGETGWVQKAFDVNALGAYHVAHYFVPLLLGSESGRKVFLAIGSLAGCIRRGPIANMGYCVSKMAQARIVEFLGEQHGGQELLAVCLHPGAVMTPAADGNTPEEFLPYLTDSIDLCGAVCVHVADKAAGLRWMTGRMMSAIWNMDELLGRKEEIIEKDLLKFVMAVR